MTVFRKSSCLQVPTTYQQYRYCGDWLFWNHLCVLGQVIEVSQVLNLYRQHGRKVTVDSQHDGRKWRDIAGILGIVVKYMHLNSAAIVLGLVLGGMCESHFARRCLRGRWTKRFRKENGHHLQELRKEHPALYGGTWVDTMCYETGKLFGFLKR